MLINIDYLIINLKGTLNAQKFGRNTYNEDLPNPFTLIAHQYGNKTFSNVYDLIYNGLKVGVINSNPRSNIISPDLIQLQFENNLFYTVSKNNLSQIVYTLEDYFDLQFEGINRLDIAVDNIENNTKYKDLYFDIVNGKKLIKGREKNVSSYSVTKKGTAQFNGFTIGKRSSSRFLRIYNKSESLRCDVTKPYISQWHEKNGLQPEAGKDIWRFEYQLNSTFFTYLRRLGQRITSQIFETENLIKLIQLAEKNHFEVVENTGKTETNKEKIITVLDLNKLYQGLKNATGYAITKLKRVFETSLTIQKRLVKSLFRQYYIKPSYVYLRSMVAILNEYNLYQWFDNKMKFYLNEFFNKEKITGYFHLPKFNQYLKQHCRTTTENPIVFNTNINFNNLSNVFSSFTCQY